MWAIGEIPSEGLVFITGPGGRIEFPPSEAAHIAAALADYGTDSDDAEYAADEWGGRADELREEEDEDEPEQEEGT